MRNIYTDGLYLDQNPTWHEEDSPWKAAQIVRMLQKNPTKLSTVAEIGCGAGAILEQLYPLVPDDVQLHGFDISPAAITRAKTREHDRLRFYQEDLLKRDNSFDLLLVMDVIEHVPDYLGFLEGCRQKARLKLYHIPLDLHVSSVLRGSFIRTRSTVGHLHYFSAESALATLVDTGHTIVDSFYTNGGIALASVHPSVKRTIANAPRSVVARLSTPWAARLFGGYSLMVLTK